MRWLRVAALLAVAGGSTLLTAGCHDGDDDTVVENEDEYDSWYLIYTNGHPVAVAASYSGREEDLIDLINIHRVASGRDALIACGRMSDVALAHSVHMDLHHFTGEFNPEGDFAVERAHKAGLSFFAYAEMTAAGTSDVYEAFDGWNLHPPYSQLIHDPSMTHIGVGYHEGYWTADLAER